MRTCKRRPFRWGLLGVLACLAVSASAATGASLAAAAGVPPPEWHAGNWPSHNHDLSNTRAAGQSPINSGNVSGLEVKWRFPLVGGSFFGSFASNPIVVG